jgi:hypothetical protein
MASSSGPTYALGNMNAASIKLLTVIIGSEYKADIRDMLVELGVPGFTYFEVHGHGEHDPRIRFLDGTNIQVQVLAKHQVTERILATMETRYPSVPLVAYVYDVHAMPAGHFG